jgi:hypothetical protein
MSDTPQSNPNPPSVQEVAARLHDVAREVRRSRSLDSHSQRVLAELVEELSQALAEPNVPPAEVARLAESTAQLAESLHRQHDRGLLERARDGLEGAVIEAESHAPTAVGLARRLLDALGNIGI